MPKEWMELPQTGMRDMGPVYAETNLNRFPAEPWATFTNIIFLLVVVYWARRIRGKAGRHGMMRLALPILVLGWFGGTVYHATRSHVIWLTLDWMPILVLALVAAWWFWRGALGRPLLALAGVLIPFVIMMGVHGAFHGMPRSAHITVGYCIMAASIILPSALHCIVRYRAGWPWLVAAVGLFVIAITARQIDMTLGVRLLPMGTHFLWHIFGGMATFCLFGYIYGAGETAFSLAGRSLGEIDRR